MRTGRILAMDDDAIVRMLIYRILSNVGHQTVVAVEGNEVISVYCDAIKARQPFDAVILGIKNAIGLGGLETISQLLKIDPGIKAVVSSGYSDHPVMANYDFYGFTSRLPKPYRPNELTDIIRTML